MLLQTYDPGWPEEFERAAAAIRAVAPAWEVEHIGSTSLVGMAAKPIIDLAVRIVDEADLEQRLPALTAIGWLRIAAGPRTHRVLVRQQGERRTHIAHFFTAEQWDTCHQRIFAAWLRSHEDARERYLAVKRAAEAKGLAGRAYTLRKLDVVAEITNEARAARGLPPAQVWDK